MFNIPSKILFLSVLMHLLFSATMASNYDDEESSEAVCIGNHS